MKKGAGSKFAFEPAPIIIFRLWQGNVLLYNDNNIK